MDAKNFSSVLQKPEEKKKVVKTDIDIFAEDALIKASKKSNYYLNLVKEIIATVNAVPTTNTKLSSLGITNLAIDSNDIDTNLSILFDIKVYQKLVKDLKFTKQQYNLLVNNYIMKKTFPKDLKDSSVNIKKIFEGLSGKK